MLHFFFSFLNQWNARPSTNEAIKTHFTAMLYCGGQELNLQYRRGRPVRAFSGEAIGTEKLVCPRLCGGAEFDT